MPQGPTSRGCEACKAQKKKCDQVQPKCSRCRRLRIACVGCGNRNFIFSFDKRMVLPQSQLDTSPRLTFAPSNATTCLQNALVTRLKASDDVRYSIAFRYGGFLNGIPRRLGNNKALDDAVVALLARHTETVMRQDQSDPQAPAVVEYNRALAALRTILADDSLNSTSETLCAAMLLVYCQARFDDQFTFFCSPHGRGIAQLLRIRNFGNGKTPFEIQLFGPLYATVLLQSFANPNVCLSSWEYQRLEKLFWANRATTPHIQHWLLMIQISQLMAQARCAIASGYSLNKIAIKAKELQESLQAVITFMHDRLQEVENPSCGQVVDNILHPVYQRIYGVELATMAILLCARRTLSPQDSMLPIIAADVCHKILHTCHNARAYRPVAAVWTVHSLICAWCATEDTALKAQIEEALVDYQKDAMGPRAEVQMSQLRLLERRLNLLE